MIYLLSGLVFIMVFLSGMISGFLIYNHSLKLASNVLSNLKDGLPLMGKDVSGVEEPQEFIGENVGENVGENT